MLRLDIHAISRICRVTVVEHSYLNEYYWVFADSLCIHQPKLWTMQLMQRDLGLVDCCQVVVADTRILWRFGVTVVNTFVFLEKHSENICSFCMVYFYWYCSYDAGACSIVIIHFGVHLAVVTSGHYAQQRTFAIHFSHGFTELHKASQNFTKLHKA